MADINMSYGLEPVRGIIGERANSRFFEVVTCQVDPTLQNHRVYVGEPVFERYSGSARKRTATPVHGHMAFSQMQSDQAIIGIAITSPAMANKVDEQGRRYYETGDLVPVAVKGCVFVDTGISMRTGHPLYFNLESRKFVRSAEAGKTTRAIGVAAENTNSSGMSIISIEPTMQYIATAGNSLPKEGDSAETEQDPVRSGRL